MRFSDGMEVTYGKDHRGSAVIIEGGSAGRRLTSSEVWVEDREAHGAARCWRVPAGKTLERVASQCPAEYLDVLLNTIDGMAAGEPHPALRGGLAAEARRLLPEIASEAEGRFGELVAFLESELDLDVERIRAEERLPFSDDIGPNLLVLIDGEVVVLPEIPPLYLAPASWRVTMWRVANHMIGPLLFPDVAESERIQVVGLSIPAEEYSPRMEGLFCYHAARYVLMFEAWQGNAAAPHLTELVRLIQAGVRPLRRSVTRAS